MTSAENIETLLKQVRSLEASAALFHKEAISTRKELERFYAPAPQKGINEEAMRHIADKMAKRRQKRLKIQNK